MPKGVYDHYRIKGSKHPNWAPKETRTCVAPGCDNTFECTTANTKKYCCRGHQNIGKHPTEETMEKIRVSNSGKNNRLYGKTYEEYFGEEEAKEIKRKIGEANEGRKRGPETIEKMHEAKKGKTFEEIYGDKAEDMKNNLRIKLTGQHFQTEKSKERIGEASLERWQDEEYRKKCILEISNAFSAERKEEQRGRMLGDKNPSYIDGRGNFPYALEFNEVFRILIRERDSHICQLCGKTKEDEGQNLSVHHVYYDKENSDTTQKDL